MRSNSFYNLPDGFGKKYPWKQTSVEQNSFDTLLRLLVASIIRQYDKPKPCNLQMYANGHALRAVLFQGIKEKGEHPIDYASSLLNNSKKNYSTSERQHLKIVWALNKFIGYIELLQNYVTKQIW